MVKVFFKGQLTTGLYVKDCFFFFKDVIYLFMRDTQRERQRYRQREKQSPCKEPDVGLEPGTPGSHPGPKAGTQPLSHSSVLFF